MVPTFMVKPWTAPDLEKSRVCKAAGRVRLSATWTLRNIVNGSYIASPGTP